MRFRNRIISFGLTFATGVGLALEPSITDRLWPSFSQGEAAVEVGGRVRNRRAKEFRGMKCPEEGFCEEVLEGEPGTIIGAERVPDGGYFLVVRWDEPNHDGRPFYSYVGRYTFRKSIDEE